jgi:hypothetical protein
LIGLAVLTYSVHLFLLAGILIGVFFPKFLVLTLALWIVKILVEYPIVWLMASFLDKKHLLGYYFVAQVFQLFYVVAVGLLGRLVSFEWKGRRRVQ